VKSSLREATWQNCAIEGTGHEWQTQKAKVLASPEKASSKFAIGTKVKFLLF
jgi:hypothetical protein